MFVGLALVAGSARHDLNGDERDDVYRNNLHHDDVACSEESVAAVLGC